MFKGLSLESSNLQSPKNCDTVSKYQFIQSKKIDQGPRSQKFLISEHMTPDNDISDFLQNQSIT